jgi:hypothetical protein
MEDNAEQKVEFQPEVYCLRCHLMEWDENRRCCANFEESRCPLSIRRILKGLDVSCLVV